MYEKVKRKSVATVAQWINLRLPFCGPGFKSQAHYLRFLQSIFLLYLLLCWETYENKQKEAGYGR